jgi:hypothetical protein
MQLSRRFSDARMQEKVLSRSSGQARTRRTTWSRAAVASRRCANVGTDATRFAAGSNRRDVGRVFGPERVCNTRPNPARADSAPQSAPWSAAVMTSALLRITSPNLFGPTIREFRPIGDDRSKPQLVPHLSARGFRHASPSFGDCVHTQPAFSKIHHKRALGPIYLRFLLSVWRNQERVAQGVAKQRRRSREQESIFRKASP